MKKIKILVLLRSLQVLLIAFIIWFILTDTFAQTQLTPVSDEVSPYFNGKLLIASDADQIGTAYADGVINKVEGVEDSLTILQFNDQNQIVQQQIHASNSVISWPAIVAHSPDGRLAYVVETRGVFRGDQQKMKNVYDDMPTGNQLSVLDISGKQPEIVQQIKIGKNPHAVSVNASGNLLVTTSDEKGKELVLARLEKGLVKEIHTYPLEGLEREGTNGGANFAAFHPAQNLIAVIKDNRSVAFYRVAFTGERLSVDSWGNPVSDVGEVLSVGNFTPDGRHFIVSDVGWGDSSLGNVFNGKGYLISIRLGDKDAHEIVNKARVGLSPEGFDIAPNGKWAIAVNMRRTYLPKGFPYFLFGARKRSSLSLVKINSQTGELTTVGNEYGFEGELPEDAVFDLDSRGIAVTIYNERYEAFPRKGYIEFWQLDGEKLIRTEKKIPVTRGAHCLEVVRK